MLGFITYLPMRVTYGGENVGDTTIKPRPLIGICMRPADANPNHASVDVRYVKRVEAAGGNVVMLPYGFEAAAEAPAIIGRIDGLLLTGGGDIAPESFGGSPYAERCVATISLMSADRDVFEWAAARAAAACNLPVLGVCRGLQVMNVTMGGHLVRDISELGDVAINHQQTDKPTEIVHDVHIKPGTQLARILGQETLGVNSLHHQAIAEAAPTGLINAWATDGTAEGIEFPNKAFMVGVQWHPEILGNTPQLFEAFVDAARDYMLAR